MGVALAVLKDSSWGKRLREKHAHMSKAVVPVSLICIGISAYSGLTRKDVGAAIAHSESRIDRLSVKIAVKMHAKWLNGSNPIRGARPVIPLGGEMMCSGLTVISSVRCHLRWR